MNSNYNIDRRITELNRCFERFSETRVIRNKEQMVINVKSVIEFMKDRASKTLLHILGLMFEGSKFVNFNTFLLEFYYFTCEGGYENYVEEYFKSHCSSEVTFNNFRR